MRRFDRDLQLLTAKLLEMGKLVDDAVYRSVQAVVTKNEQLTEQIFKNEAQINQLEIEIDDLAVSLLALQAPMASDLRLVIAAIDINTELERMGDLSVSIARSATDLISGPNIPLAVDILQMAEFAQRMVRQAIEAFLNRNADLAQSVLASDEAVDTMRAAGYKDLVAFMEGNPKQIRPALFLLGVVRSIERIADHATNIAEDVLFLVKGIDVRHQREER